jgi:hypothetical protein
MNVGIIGTPNRDKLILPSGAKVVSWGGVIYNILTLSHYFSSTVPSSTVKVRPICPLGADSREDFLEILKRFPNIETDAVLHNSQQQNRIVLKCITQDEKEEAAQLTLPPIPFEHLAKHLGGLKFLLINFTSGRDISLETLRNIRETFKETILVDVHSLTLSEPDSKGLRRRIAFRNWQDWLEGMDYVQFTWPEAASLTGEINPSVAGVVEVADWLLERGTRGVIVTRGAEGAYYFHTDDHGILREEIPPFKLRSILDSTGCGDVFSSAFIYQLTKRVEPIAAAKFAVKAAAMNATVSGIGPWLV